MQKRVSERVSPLRPHTSTFILLFYINIFWHLLITQFGYSKRIPAIWPYNCSAEWKQIYLKVTAIVTTIVMVVKNRMMMKRWKRIWKAANKESNNNDLDTCRHHHLVHIYKVNIMYRFWYVFWSVLWFRYDKAVHNTYTFSAISPWIPYLLPVFQLIPLKENVCGYT